MAHEANPKPPRAKRKSDRSSESLAIAFPYDTEEERLFARIRDYKEEQRAVEAFDADRMARAHAMLAALVGGVGLEDAVRLATRVTATNLAPQYLTEASDGRQRLATWQELTDEFKRETRKELRTICRLMHARSTRKRSAPPRGVVQEIEKQVRGKGLVKARNRVSDFMRARQAARTDPTEESFVRVRMAGCLAWMALRCVATDPIEFDRHSRDCLPARTMLDSLIDTAQAQRRAEDRSGRTHSIAAIVVSMIAGVTPDSGPLR